MLLPGLRTAGAQAIPPQAAAAGVVSVICLPLLGMVLQKRLFLHDNVLSSFAVQNIGGMAVCLLLALVFQERTFEPIVTVPASWLWAIVCIGGANFGMVYLTRRLDPSRIASLVLLAPPLAAVQGYFFSATPSAPCNWPASPWPCSTFCSVGRCGSGRKVFRPPPLGTGIFRRITPNRPHSPMHDGLQREGLSDIFPTKNNLQRVALCSNFGPISTSIRVFLAPPARS